MKPNQWQALAHFYRYALHHQKMELLLAQREMLFQQQDELLQIQATLARRQREMLERQTVHELQCHLFWLRLRQTTFKEQCHEAEVLPAPGYPPYLEEPLEFASRLLSGGTCR